MRQSKPSFSVEVRRTRRLPGPKVFDLSQEEPFLDEDVPDFEFNQDTEETAPVSDDDDYELAMRSAEAAYATRQVPPTLKRQPATAIPSEPVAPQPTANASPAPVTPSRPISYSAPKAPISPPAPRPAMSAYTQQRPVSQIPQNHPKAAAFAAAEKVFAKQPDVAPPATTARILPDLTEKPIVHAEPKRRGRPPKIVAEGAPVIQKERKTRGPNKPKEEMVYIDPDQFNKKPAVFAEPKRRGRPPKATISPPVSQPVYQAASGAKIPEPVRTAPPVAIRELRPPVVTTRLVVRPVRVPVADIIRHMVPVSVRMTSHQRNYDDQAAISAARRARWAGASRPSVTVRNNDRNY